MASEPETTEEWKPRPAFLRTDRQNENFSAGYSFCMGGFPRAAPHDESEWRYWLFGWDCAQAKKNPVTDTTDVLVRAREIMDAGGIAAERAGETEIHPGIVPELCDEIERLRGVIRELRAVHTSMGDLFMSTRDEIR